MRVIFDENIISRMSNAIICVNESNNNKTFHSELFNNVEFVNIDFDCHNRLFKIKFRKF
jgi:hypothetical protein